MTKKRVLLLFVAFVLTALSVGLILYLRNPAKTCAFNCISRSDPRDDDFFIRLDAHEQTLLKEKTKQPVVEREARSLKIKGAGNEVIELRDCLDCGPEKDVEHHFVDRFENPASVLIYRQFYESDDYVLVTIEGQQYEIPSYPVFSPDRQRFVVVSAAEAFNWNGIELWEKDGSRYLRNLKFEPKGSELYRMLGWDGNEKVKLEFSKYNDPDSGEAVCQGAELVKSGREWNVKTLDGVSKDDFCAYTEDWIPEFLRRYGKDSK